SAVCGSSVARPTGRRTVTKTPGGAQRLRPRRRDLRSRRVEPTVEAGKRNGAVGVAPSGAVRPAPPPDERCSMPVPLSILDLATAARGQTPVEALEGTVALARTAEETGYERVWYAEHHNMASIASSATSVLIAHVAAHTSSIRLGAGGVMLPNHSPLVIAEQFGTLETLHPGRIDLGLGRAPGTDQNTMRALRRTAASADSFPQDVLELQGYLQGQSRIQGVDAYPGKGTDVPLYIL